MEDHEWDRLFQNYEKKFGAPFPMTVGDTRSTEEIKAEIRKCLQTGTPEPEPDFSNLKKYEVI